MKKKTASKPRSARRPYQAPKLVVHGTLEQITLSVGGGVLDGGTRRNPESSPCYFDLGGDTPKPRKPCA